MPKRKDEEWGNALFESLLRLTQTDFALTDPAGDWARFMASGSQRAGELRMMKKFRFQLLHRWLIEHFEPCRVADVAGGKGFLSYLLQHSGWDAVVIDPVAQALPTKYKDIVTGRRVRIPPTTKIARADRPFDPELARHFDLLIGMHAHGCNAQIIDAALAVGCGFVLFPCCVIDEPFVPPPGVHWLQGLAEYALNKGHTLYPFRLNFKGQNIGLCSIGTCAVKPLPV